MNVKTLECMEIPARDGGYVIMKPCRNTYDRQSMTCITGTDEKMGIMIGGKENNNRFLHLKKISRPFGIKYYRAIYKRNSDQLWYSNETQSCGSKITYAGISIGNMMISRVQFG